MGIDEFMIDIDELLESILHNVWTILSKKMKLNGIGRFTPNEIFKKIFKKILALKIWKMVL